MVNVSKGPYTGDAHLLMFPGQHTFLIDTGFDRYARARLIPVIRHRAIDELETVIITHAHKNHYGGLLSLHDAGIRIGKVLLNMPDPGRCEADWSCDYAHVNKLVSGLRQRGIPVEPIKAGQTLYQSPEHKLSMRVLYVYDGVNTPAGKTDINDTSPIIRLEAGHNSALLTGDLNKPIGTWLAQMGKQLRADILKVPHHGVESAAPDSFFERVAARVALVPGSGQMWYSNRGQRLREYFASRNTVTYVNGLHGHITVKFYEDHFRVITDKLFRPRSGKQARPATGPAH
jgi:competence protein ComEC